MKRSLIWLAIMASGTTVSEGLAAVANDDKAGALQNNAHLHLETVIVSATLHKTVAETALPVTVMSGADLQQRAASSIGATLDSSPGLANASFGPGVGQPVIRGQQGPRVQVLENGASSGDASGVSADHAVTVEAMLAESIEVLRGPSTLLYGGGAIGGVVNVIDNRIPKQAVDGQLFDGVSGAIEYRHDNNDDGNTSVFKLDGGSGAIGWHLDGVYRDWGDIEIPGSAFNRAHIVDTPDSSGFVGNTAGRNHGLSGGVSWLFDSGYLGVSVSDMSNYYGIPAVAGGESGIHIDMQQQRYDVAGEWGDLGDLVEALRWRLTYTDYAHEELEDTGAVGTRFTNKTWQNRVELVHGEIAGWHGVVGLQLKRSDFAALGEESFVPESITQSAGLFAVEDYHFDDVIYELGLRVDRDSVDPLSQNSSAVSHTMANVSTGAIWQFASDWNLGLALSRSQRAPTVEELFANMGNDAASWVVHGATQSIEVGDVGLHEEVSQNIDVTLSHKSERYDGFVTFFHNQFRDFIFLANTGRSNSDGVPVLFYSQENAQFNGVEFNLTTQLAQNEFGKLSADIYGDNVQGELDRSGDVPRMPPWRIGARLHWALRSWSAYAGVLKAAAQTHPGAFETSTDDYARLDAGVSYTLAMGQVFVRGTNLSNQSIRASTSFLRDYSPEPGRSIETGVRFSF